MGFLCYEVCGVSLVSIIKVSESLIWTCVGFSVTGVS